MFANQHIKLATLTRCKTSSTRRTRRVLVVVVEFIVIKKIEDKRTEVPRRAVPIKGKRREIFGATKLG